MCIILKINIKKEGKKEGKQFGHIKLLLKTFHGS